MAESHVARKARVQKEALLREEASNMRLLARRWLAVERALEAELLKTILALQEKGIVTEAMILRDERFQRLLWQARAEYGKFADDFQASMENIQQYALQRGITDAKQVLKFSMESAGLSISFEMLNVDAIEVVIGLTADGTRLQVLLMRDYGTAVTGMFEALVRGVALGLNPRKIAQDMAKEFGIGLSRALTIARTEMMRAYRMATQEQYRKSDVVSGYKRLAVKDDKTCLGCLMMDGETFENAEDFSEHPNGRCTLVPIVRGATAPEWTNGKEWLAGLSEDRQRAILGDQRYELWKSGAVSLDQFATLKENETWGGAYVPTPLNQLTQVNNG